ncbi:hypothetical protein LZ30DRAFT_273467 [Colletotrichum cereale]|nr:hypothetical protein LZ30DRAFT_273467 [Colletotrichum cereale]
MVGCFSRADRVTEGPLVRRAPGAPCYDGAAWLGLGGVACSQLGQYMLVDCSEGNSVSRKWLVICTAMHTIASRVYQSHVRQLTSTLGMDLPPSRKCTEHAYLMFRFFGLRSRFQQGPGSLTETRCPRFQSGLPVGMNRTTNFTFRYETHSWMRLIIRRTLHLEVGRSMGPYLHVEMICSTIPSEEHLLVDQFSSQSAYLRCWLQRPTASGQLWSSIGEF